MSTREPNRPASAPFTDGDNLTFMIARSKRGEPIWQTNRKGRPFIIEPDGITKRNVGAFWWWPWGPSKLRHLPKPHLTYTQVAVANEKSKLILRALRNGPIYLEKGFLKGRDGKIITTKSISRIVLHWLEGCGVVLKRTPMRGGRVMLDIDVDATNKNNVR